MTFTEESIRKKYDLIICRLQEVLGNEKLKEILKKRNLKIYWCINKHNIKNKLTFKLGVLLQQGNPISVRLFIRNPTFLNESGYFVPILKIADFLKSEAEVEKILYKSSYYSSRRYWFCFFVSNNYVSLRKDIHAFLDNLKTPIDTVKYRARYYEFIIKAMLKSIGVPIEKLRFVLGSSYQLTSAYSMDNFRLCKAVTEHDAKKAGSEVIKQVDKAFLSGLLYPGMQALDEEYLDFDQRKIFTFAEKYLPLLGYKKRIHLMSPMVPGLTGGKMSASGSENNKIDILDDAETIKKKVNKAFCADGIIENNGLLAFAKYIIFPILELKETPILEINKKQGDSLVYNCYDHLETDYANKKLLPQDLKLGIINALNYLLEPIRKEFKENKEFQETLHFAYPNEEKRKPGKMYHKNSKFIQSKHTVITQNHDFHLTDLQVSTSSLSID
ncbi:hypothetical protein PCK2_000718 [Pneumocystis canis]|nr:hypothetical protein PCK2_000718 [Pneumocystis canis]